MIRADITPVWKNGQWSYTNNSAIATTKNSNSSGFEMIDNYIYVYHTGMLVALPTFPEQLNDQMSATWQPTNILGRSNPIYSYSYSQGRSMQFDLKLHREMMCNIKYYKSSLVIQQGKNSLGNLNDDYVDILIRELQACAVPKYAASEKMVDPPMAAVRFGDELFIKGIVNGQVGVTYSGPILSTNKYAQVDVSFTVTEVDPYDSDTIMELGSMRGLNTTLERNIWRGVSGSSGMSAVNGGVSNTKSMTHI